jgi:UDP-N-acetyl-2-amino-2-deoxyglucuronate dehydrogenase
MNDVLGFGIVGTGNVAAYHAQAISRVSGAQLRAVCRSNARGSAEAAARFGVHCEPSLAALLARPDVDAVCVCTPSGLHAAHTIAAAQAGKHVLVEKPLALTLSDADAMIAACQAANVQLGVALQRRATPLFRGLREAIGRDELGRLVLGSVSVPYLRTPAYYASAAWRGTWALDGGGVLMNQGIHLLDLLLWYLGDAHEVQAQAATLAHAIEVEDCLTATVRFASGALGSIAATTAAEPGFAHRVELYGTRGGVQLEGEQLVRWEASSPPPVAVAAHGQAAAGAGASPTGISDAGHTLLLADFVDAVRQQRPPLVTGEEGRRSLALVLAIYAAARSGGVVRLA